MMPVVRINDATFADLRTISTWLGTATPSQTIDQIVKQAMDQLGMERDDEADVASGAVGGHVTEFEKAPGLGFTKPVSASVAGSPISKPTWRAILVAVITALKAKGFVGETLVRQLNIPAKTVRYEIEGYNFHPELGLSVQGQSASDAWKEIDRIAKNHGIPVVVEFEWRQNPKAQFPGRSGVLRAPR